MLFARLTGRLDWACPACNKMHVSYLKAQYKALQCNNCFTKYIPGFVFYKAPTGPRAIPRDTLMIATGFTVRRLVNRVYCDACGEEIVSKVTHEMATHEHNKAHTEETVPLPKPAGRPKAIVAFIDPDSTATAPASQSPKENSKPSKPSWSEELD